MTTNSANSFTYIDGVGAINMSDGVVRMDMLSITGFENEKPVNTDPEYYRIKR